MTLDQFLNLPGSPSVAEFGQKCDPPLSAVSVWRIRNGRQNITRDTMRSIIAASGNIVTADGLTKPLAKDEAA
ncbi:MAG: hypothetical protein V4661_15520 [Pseudomonadota bacterium]